MAEVQQRGILFRKNLYLISFDLNPSRGRQSEYTIIDQRIEKLGHYLKPTMQIRLLAHQGNASAIRNALRSETFLQGPRKGQTVLRPNDRIFVMKLQKSVAWNRARESDLLRMFIDEVAGA